MKLFAFAFVALTSTAAAAAAFNESVTKATDLRTTSTYTCTTSSTSWEHPKPPCDVRCQKYRCCTVGWCQCLAAELDALEAMSGTDVKMRSPPVPVEGAVPGKRNNLIGENLALVNEYVKVAEAHGIEYDSIKPGAAPRLQTGDAIINCPMHQYGLLICGASKCGGDHENCDICNRIWCSGAESCDLSFC